MEWPCVQVNIQTVTTGTLSSLSLVAQPGCRQQGFAEAPR